MAGGPPGPEDWVGEARELAREALETCSRCMLCSAACIPARALGRGYAPPDRLEAAARVLLHGEAGERELRLLYTCSLCGACSAVCPYSVPVWRLVHAARTVLAEKGVQPREHRALLESYAASGHSFYRDPERPRRILVETARAAGVAVDEPADTLYVPSPFETSIYPHLLEAGLRLLRRSVSVTVSTRLLDLGGNAVVDAAGVRLLGSAVERLMDEAERLGAKRIVLSGCGSDVKLAEIAGLEYMSLYEALGEEARGSCRGCVLYPSCGFSRFARSKLPGVTRAARRTGVEGRQKPWSPFTPCCGGGGGISYLRSGVLGELRRRIYRWRAERLRREARGGTVVTPCVKCYTVYREALLQAGLHRPRVVHLTQLLRSPREQKNQK